uniref:hypothetical protein n=1 Tax=Flammeovirga sp. OC4 TaxID=1382345 RepID=UPI0005C56405
LNRCLNGLRFPEASAKVKTFYFNFQIFFQKFLKFFFVDFLNAQHSEFPTPKEKFLKPFVKGECKGKKRNLICNAYFVLFRNLICNAYFVLFRNLIYIADFQQNQIPFHYINYPNRVVT